MVVVMVKIILNQEMINLFKHVIFLKESLGGCILVFVMLIKPILQIMMGRGEDV